jgi:hypothetical protein
MGLVYKAAKGLKGLLMGKGGRTLGERIKGSALNPGSWTEDIASGMGVRTRGPLKYQNAGRPERKGMVFNKQKKQYEQGIIQSGIPASGGYRELTGAGMAAQGVGLGGAGLLGYNMIAGTEPARDERGVKTGMRDEDAFKVREKYQKEKLGGSKRFTPALLEMNSKNSQWVKTAIQGIGMDRYKQMRRAVMEDPSKASALHQKLIDQLAAVGDEEMMKQAASEPYVLPGVARVGEGSRRVVVITPTKGKDKETNYTALQYEYEGDDE